MIVVVDYGMGNLRSVSKALEKAGAEVLISSKPADLKKAEKIVFPGVGAFGMAMQELKKRKLDKALIDEIKAGKPFLGLCLGLQLLFSESFEKGKFNGLGIFKGKVIRFKSKTLKIPQIGWNKINFVKKCPLFSGIKNNSYMYFVHSYFVAPLDKDIISATTGYAGKFCSAVWKDNIFGLQFHPEKSQKDGLRILKNFVDLK